MRSMPFAVLALAVVTPATIGASAPSSRLIEQLHAADANHDGVVTRAEYAAWRTAQWQRMDRNGDGFFTRDDLPAMLRDRWDSQRIAKLREDFDRNHDGRISRAEFVNGPMPGFDLADTNHDGVVTGAEVEAAKAKLEQ